MYNIIMALAMAWKHLFTRNIDILWFQDVPWRWWNGIMFHVSYYYGALALIYFKDRKTHCIFSGISICVLLSAICNWGKLNWLLFSLDVALMLNIMASAVAWNHFDIFGFRKFPEGGEMVHNYNNNFHYSGSPGQRTLLTINTWLSLFHPHVWISG